MKKASNWGVVAVVAVVVAVVALCGRAMGYGRAAGAGSYSMDLDTPTPVPGRDDLPGLRGIPTPSDTYRPKDQGTDWPVDAFTAMVMGHQSPEPIDRPALNSYAGDGNMEALDVYGPFSHQETADIANYTGGVGPAGRSTPEMHPEPTAPDGTLHPLGADGGIGGMPTGVA